MAKFGMRIIYFIKSKVIKRWLVYFLYNLILVIFPTFLFGQDYTEAQDSVNSLNNRAEYFKNINSDSSYFYASKALDTSMKISYEFGEIKALHNLGEYYIDEGQYSKAKDALDRSIALSKKGGFVYLEALSKSKKAAYFYFTGAYNSALKILEPRVEKIIGKKDKKQLANLLNLISYIYAKKGLFSEALKRRYKVLNLRIASGNEDEIAKSYNALGDFYLQQNNYYKALKFYFSSFETSEKSNNLRGLGISLNNIANVYYCLGQLNKSLEYQLKSIKIKKKTGNLKELGISYRNLGMVYSAKKDYEHSSNFLKKAEAIFDSTKSLPLYAETMYSKAEVMYNQQLYDSALFYWEKTEMLGREINSNSLLLQTYQALAQLYLSINDDEDKLRYYYEKQMQLADSLKIFENRSAILELQGRFEDEVFQEKLDKVEEEKELTEMKLAKIEIQRFYLFLMFCTAMFLIFLVLFFYRKSKKNSSMLASHNKIINTQNDHLKSLNRELSDSKIELEKINATKDKLFAIISHDVRSPLTSLDGLLDVISDQPQQMETSEIRRMFKLLKNKLNTVNSFLNNLLEWARIQDNSIKVNKTTFVISDTIKKVANLYLDQAHKKNITIAVNGDAIKGLNVIADRNMVEFILRNLLINAIKFSHPNSTIHIVTKITDKNVEVIIKDNGIGLTEEECLNLFDLKNQVAKKGTFSETGSGLGLILSKEFIEKNEGKIWVESEHGKGSSFKFTLPILPIENHLSANSKQVL